MSNLVKANNCSLSDLANNIQNEFDIDKDLNTPPEGLDPELLDEWNEANQDRLNNIAAGRIAAVPTTNPNSPEINDVFQEYISNYDGSTLHSSADFDEWKLGCGSVSESMWWKDSYCPCDCKKVAYVSNGAAVTNDIFYILPDGKSVVGPPPVDTNLVINGKLVEKKVVTFTPRVKIESNAVTDRSLGGNLKTKALIVSSQEKQEFILT